MPARNEYRFSPLKTFVTLGFLRIIMLTLLTADRRRRRSDFGARRNRRLGTRTLIPRGSHAATARYRRPSVEHAHQRLWRQGILDISASHVDIQSVSTIGKLY